MGNSVGKIEDNEWEFTVRVKKRPLRRHEMEEEQEQEQELADDQNGAQETVAEFDFGVKQNKPSPRKTPVKLTPLNVGSPGLGKKKLRKTSASGVDYSAAVADSTEPTPRGRKSTCVTINENGDNHPSLDIRVIKSHLAPLWNLIIPADFVTKHMLKDNKESKTYEIVNGDKCKTLQLTKSTTSRYILSKKNWQEFAMEHKLELEDFIRLELVGDTQVRVEVFKKQENGKKPEVDLPDPTAEDEEDTPVPVPLMTVTTDSINTVDAEEPRQ